ncbi:MAG: hypothetical protein AB1589_18755 [Cyanobacteriota bacterium]
MSHYGTPEKPNPSTDPEQERSEQTSNLKDTVDPQDLALKGRSVSNPDELGSNPAVVPQMLNEPAVIREGFDFNRDAD